MTPEQIGVAALLVTAIGVGIAWLALRSQRRGQRPHLKVNATVGTPVYGMTGRSFAGSTLGATWFGIEVHNDGLMPVTVSGVGIRFRDGGHAPFISAPWPGADDLPKPLAPYESATFWVDEMPKVTEAHREHRADRAYARLGGTAEFTSKPIGRWLDGWIH